VGSVYTYSVANGYLYDLSGAGAFVATDLVVDRGCRIELEIAVPGIDEPKSFQATVARCASRVEGSRGAIPAGLGITFLTDTETQLRNIRDFVMSTLTLDLLNFGYNKQARPVAKMTDSYRAKSHPILWKFPAVEDAAVNGGSTPENEEETEMTVRLQAGEPLTAAEPCKTDLAVLWNLDEELLGLTTSSVESH
jgi:hypothetical protein